MVNTYFEHDIIEGKSFDRKILKFVWGYLKKYKIEFFISVIISLLTSVLVISVPYITANIIDKGIEPRVYAQVVKFGVILFIIQLFHFVIFGVQLYLTQVVGAKVVHDIRVDLFNYVQDLPITYFDKNPIGRIVTRLTNDVAALGEMFSEGAVMMLFNIVFIIGAMSFIIYLDWKLGLIALSTFPVLCFVTYKISILLRSTKRKVREKLAVINAFLSEHISGMKLINAFCQENEVIKKFKVANDEHMDISIKQANLYAIIIPLITLMTGISISLIIWYGGFKVLHNNLTIGIFVAYISYIEWIMNPLRDIVERYNVFLQSSTATERLYKISKLDKENLDDEEKELDQIEGEISFNEVSFSYEKETPVLRNISFNIKNGERVAIVGETGSGKSTILNLISKFYLPDTGKIYFDKSDIRYVDRNNLRNFVGKIDQNVHIFSGAIGENITLGRKISPEVLDKALRTSNCYKVINKRKEGLNFVLTEGGKNISFGERQLIAFARLMAYDPKIMLMDEATSNIDSENEKDIIEAIEHITHGKTSIIVAHRLSTITNADRIFVIDKGKLVESGTHSELLAANGKYTSLYSAMSANIS